jgi:ribonuclease HI
LTKWASGWEAKGWKKASRGEIQNLELVKDVYGEFKKSKAKLVWVRGHVGEEYNEIADEWANKARAGERLD